VEWIEGNLLDAETGLVWDGLHVNPDGSIRDVEKNVYSYCQGVFLGACVELAERDGPGSDWATRAARTIDAVTQRITVPDGSAGGLVIRGQGGGDGGLFGGILARYLSLAATALPEVDAGLAEPAKLASSLVFSSAEAAWRNRAIAPGGPLFGPDWTKPAVLPRYRPKAEGHLPERDLSVQVGAWMLLEAAALLEGTGHRAHIGRDRTG
jgi:predicted alpha-1,6-mannanase (GH76 family)